MPVSRSVDVFEHRDYRAYLREYYEQGRKAGAAVSLRAFSRRAGLRSSNYLKLVIEGARNLSPTLAQRFAAAAGLSGEAAAYFCELVAFNQAKTATERETAYARLSRFPAYRKVHKLEAAQAAYHAQWYLPAIRELAAREDFRDDPKWIARTLAPAITAREAQSAIATLLELGLLVRDADGKLAQAESLIETPEGPLGHHVMSFHRAMLARATDALDRFPRQERHFMSVTMCVSEEQLAQLKEHLTRVYDQILQLYPAGADAARVVQINLNMFPLSNGRSEP